MESSPISPEELQDIRGGMSLEEVWTKLDNVELTTVGVDIGSTTSHLMFARVHMQRLGEDLSSRFVVVGREILWRSPILLTPYLPDYRIDGAALGEFVRTAYEKAGLQRSDVDSGAVILTGEALKRTNSRAIADLFADESGKFVCASAGHYLEAQLAAYGSGAVALSEQKSQVVLNVDIGGGTTKFALIRDGVILQTCAVAVGARLIARDEGRKLVRVEGPAQQIASTLGIDLVVGGTLTEADEARIVERMTDVIFSYISQAKPDALASALLLTDPIPLDIKPQAMTFSGGVSEYIYGREPKGYRDLGRELAASLLGKLSSGGRAAIPVLDAPEGIRATVIGASQFSVQISGSTIWISDPAILPLRNLPVAHPELDLSDAIPPAETVGREVTRALQLFDPGESVDCAALAFRWQGQPSYSRLRALAEGLLKGLPAGVDETFRLVLLVEGDVARSLGGIVKRDLGFPGDVVSIDGVSLQQFDYVDIGEKIMPTDVVPVVVKSLLFSAEKRALVAASDAGAS